MITLVNLCVTKILRKRSLCCNMSEIPNYSVFEIYTL